MPILRRLALVVSIVFCGSLALAAAVAAAGGGGLDPGVYNFTNKDATATFGAGQPTFSVSVDRGWNSFRPTDPRGPRVVIKNTIVALSLFDAAGNVTYGCFIVKPSDFTISDDLQSARVHTTLTADESCPGYGAPFTGQKEVNQYAGGPGTLPLPISLDVTWTGLGVIATGTDYNTFRCLDYKTVFTSLFHSSNAKASGTMSAIDGSFDTSFAVVSSSAIHATVKHRAQPSCLPQ
jgi:hypothetical protein